MKRQHGRLLELKKRALGWIGIGATLILLYAALRLTINYFAAPSLATPVQELHAWFAVLLYWFLYAPAALVLSLHMAKWSGIDR